MPGVEINGIAEFSPTEIPGLILWVKADKTKLITSTIQKYAQNLSPSIANQILQQYSANPNQVVVTEIQSDVTDPPNSLVRLELDTESARGFPKFITQPGALDVIDMSNMLDPASNQKQIYKLTTKAPVTVTSDFSSWIISKNVAIDYIALIEKIVLSTPYVPTPSTTLLQAPDGTMIPSALPTAEFSEVIVFSGKVTAEQAQKMDGYVAYRKNEQYVLDINSPFFPTIDTLPFMNDISKQIQDTEQSLKMELETFDTSVKNYRAALPTDPILDKAPPLKEKAAAALVQITLLRKNLTKGGLLSRKLGKETSDSVFESVNALSLFTPPLTQDAYQKKLADYTGVLQELQAYVTSLGSVDQALAKATSENNASEQEQQLIAAQNVEELDKTHRQARTREFYTGLRKRSKAIDAAGVTQYDSMIAEFTKQIQTISDAFAFHAKDVESRWNEIIYGFTTIDEQISSGTWLTYVSSVDTSTVFVKTRGDVNYAIQYKDTYLNQIQTLYEELRNQIKEGDFAFVKEEIVYTAITMDNFVKRLSDKKVNPTTKKTFIPFFRAKYKEIDGYAKEFDSFYDIFTDAIKTLTDILNSVKENKIPAKLTKKYPIPIIYSHFNVTSDRYVREVNKHDNSLTMMEYIFTNPDGTILYEDTEEREVQLLFPSLEKLSRHEQDMFFTKRTPYRDNSGNQLYARYNILDPYEKTVSMLDALPPSQIIPRNFYAVNSLFEIPRGAANGICEFTIESPQKPILLPKYALTPKSYFICVNVGNLALQIQIPGIPEDMIDTLGPSEICMYTYLGPGQYGRMNWDPMRLPYDTLRDVPRSSLCSKITEFSKFVYMRTEKDPLFDKDEFLVEAIPDESGIVFDVDDVFHVNAYNVKIGPEIHLSDLVIHHEWNENMLINPKLKKLYVIQELSTSLPVFCSSDGIPATDEFGFCKYVVTPMLDINGSIRTAGALPDPIEIQLNPTASITQYGMISPIVSFNSIFRSNFVKPISVNGEIKYIFINSTGHPIVSPVNMYIEAENVKFEPPYLVFYTDAVKQVHAYIPKNLDTSIPATFPIAPYKSVDVLAKRDDIIDRMTGDILSYRFNVIKSYILGSLATIETKYDFSRKLAFAETRNTLKLLQQCYTEIEGYKTDFLTYSSNLNAIETKQMISTTDKQLKIAMDTLDLKIKEIAEKVFASFTKASNAVEFLTKVIDMVDSVKKSVKYLRDTVFIENEKSVLNLQGILQGDKQANGSPSSPEISNLLTKMVSLKVDFETRLKTLEKNVESQPKMLADLDDWIKDQRGLIKQEYKVRKQITDIETANVVDLYTKRVLNDSFSTLSKIQAARSKADEYLAYREAMALWLGIHPDEVRMRSYNHEFTRPVTDKTTKGYSISLPVFEEISNPSFSRDWESLINTVKLSDSLRSRISIELILPMQAFIKTNGSFYNGPDDTTSIPSTKTLTATKIDELKAILANSETTVNNLIANAIKMEMSLHPIFDNYKKIRSDLRTELQSIIQDQATQIQNLWTNITGQATAIQTNLQILQPYFTPEQKGVADSIGNNIDENMTADILQRVQAVQQSAKIVGFYANTSYIKMIEIQGDRDILLVSLNSLKDKMGGIQGRMESLQGEVLVSLQASVQTSLTALNNSIISAQAKLTGSLADNGNLQIIQTSVQPKADTLNHRVLNTISDCIEVESGIAELRAQIKTLVGN